MKELLILRHAKSSWREADLDDHDRPLNARGERDAPRMGALIRERDIVPEIVVSSTAVRACTTARIVAASCGFEGEVLLARELYLASPETYLHILAQSAGAARRAMVVGHNPGIEELVTRLTGAEERMPTAALARVRLPLEDWRSVGDARGELADLWRPKEL